MLNSIIGIDILQGLLGKNKGNNIFFSGDIYLGLFTQLPTIQGLDFQEPNDEAYMRIRLDTTSRISKDNFLNQAQIENNTEDGTTSAYIDNKGLIMFSETTVAWGEIVGFGLFRSADVYDQTAPFLWGEITNVEGEPRVSVDIYEVPVIRPGGFKISLV